LPASAASDAGPPSLHDALPISLQNIYRELVEDTGVPAPSTGDLSAWADAGVLLLNRSLTVQPGQPASHRGKGWEPITDAAIRARSEEHTSELQSRFDLVCRLLL